MLDGALVNGSRGTVIGFHTISEAHDMKAEITLKPKKVKRDDSISKPKPSQVEARHLRETEAIQQLAANMTAREIDPAIVGGKCRRRNGMEPLDDHTFSLMQKFPLVKFDDNNLEMLCVPLVFHEEGVTGKLEAERFQVCLLDLPPLHVNEQVLDSDHHGVGIDHPQMSGSDHDLRFY
jgi:hypothetical protein